MMQTMTDFEIEAVNGGSRIRWALDQLGRFLTVREAVNAAGSAGNALVSAEGTHNTSNPLEGNRNAK